MKRTAFIGHRRMFDNKILDKLFKAIQTQINLGCTCFTMGKHGLFDYFALSACKKLKETNKDIEIEVVITSLSQLKNEKYTDDLNTKFYLHCDDIKTIMYNIEEEHYKKRITISNKLMIDSCDTLICYVNPTKSHSGAKTAMLYAKRKGLKIVNLYMSNDDTNANIQQ